MCVPCNLMKIITLVKLIWLVESAYFECNLIYIFNKKELICTVLILNLREEQVVNLTGQCHLGGGVVIKLPCFFRQAALFCHLTIGFHAGALS